MREYDDYEQVNLFDPYDDDEEVVEEYKGFTLTETVDDNDTYTYRIYNEDDELLTKWKNTMDALELNIREYNKSRIHTFFRTEIAKYLRNAEAAKKPIRPATVVDYKDDEDDEPYYRMSGKYGAANERSGKSSSSYDYDWWKKPFSDDDLSYSYSSYTWKPKPKSTGFLDKLNKSDTLVIHPEDRTTEMLGQIYAGKGWDVLRDGNIDKDELHQLLQSHDRIIMLGHGTSGGLINKQGGGSTIGAEDAPYLKDKKIFAIWCNADKYFKQHGIGQGQFVTGNIPSDANEARFVGYTVPQKWMDENITYWSKLCADVVEQALNGNPQAAVDYVRSKYKEKYIDNETDENKIGVTQYNIDRTQVI